MEYSALITPDMVEIMLPMLGFSILMNVVLVAALLFRSIQSKLFDKLQMAWIGILLAIGSKKQTSD